MRSNPTNNISTDFIVSDGIQDNEKEQIKQWLDNLIKKDNILIPAELLNEEELKAIAKEWFPDSPKSDSTEKKIEEVNEDNEQEIEEDATSSVTVVGNEEKEELEAQNVEDTEIDKKGEEDKVTEEKGKEKTEEKEDLINPATRLVAFALNSGINLKALDEAGQGKIKALIGNTEADTLIDTDGALKSEDVKNKKTEWEQYLQEKTAQKLTPADLEKLYKFATQQEKKYLLYNLDFFSALEGSTQKDELVEAELKELANALDDSGQFRTDLNDTEVKYKWREPRTKNLQGEILTLDGQDYTELSIAEELKIKQFINNLGDDFDEDIKQKLILFATQEKLLVYNLEGNDTNKSKLKNLAGLLEIESEDENETEAKVVKFKVPSEENKEKESAETTWNKLGGLKHELMQASKQLVRLDFIPEGLQQKEEIGTAQEQKIRALLNKIFPDNDKETKNAEKINRLVSFAKRYHLPLLILESENINPSLFKPDFTWINDNLTEDSQIKFKQLEKFKTVLKKWDQYLIADTNIGLRKSDEERETFAEKIEKHETITSGISANIYDAENFRTTQHLDEIKRVDNLKFTDGIPSLPHAYTYVGTPLIQDQFYSIAFHKELLKILDDHKKCKAKSKEDPTHRENDPLVLTYWVRPDKQAHWQRFEIIIPKGNISKKNKIKIVHYDPLSKPEDYDVKGSVKKQLDKEVKDASLESIRCAFTAEKEYIEMVENTVFEGIQPIGTNVCLDCTVYQTLKRTDRTDHPLVKETGDPKDSGKLTSNQATTLRCEFVKGCLDTELRKEVSLVIRDEEIIDEYHPSQHEWRRVQQLPSEIQKKKKLDEILDGEETRFWVNKEEDKGVSPVFTELLNFVNQTSLKAEWKDIEAENISPSIEEKKYSVHYKITSSASETSLPTSEIEPTTCKVIRQRSNKLDKPGVELILDPEAAKTLNIETQIKLLALTAYTDRKQRALPNEKITVCVTELNPPGEKYLNLLKTYLAELGCEFFQGPNDAAPIALDRPASTSPTKESSASVTKVPSLASSAATSGLFRTPSASSATGESATDDEKVKKRTYEEDTDEEEAVKEETDEEASEDETDEAVGKEGGIKMSTIKTEHL